eukprot:374854-Amphidinium_carterae.1
MGGGSVRADQKDLQEWDSLLSEAARMERSVELSLLQLWGWERGVTKRHGRGQCSLSLSLGCAEGTQ